jgi:hypothetical protein
MIEKLFDTVRKWTINNELFVVGCPFFFIFFLKKWRCMAKTVPFALRLKNNFNIIFLQIAFHALEYIVWYFGVF